MRRARDWYRQLTHDKNLRAALEGRPLVAVDARNSSRVTVLSAKWLRSRSRSVARERNVRGT